MALTVIPASLPGFELNAKRLQVPFIAKATCPSCNRVQTVDLSRGNGLNYPKVGAPTDLYFYCQECDRDWSEQCVLTLALTPVVKGSSPAPGA